jgi:hypothetical protein
MLVMDCTSRDIQPIRYVVCDYIKQTVDDAVAVDRDAPGARSNYTTLSVRFFHYEIHFLSYRQICLPVLDKHELDESLTLFS